jgi:uncharacterized Zn finger protein (UPF0148 family)
MNPTAIRTSRVGAPETATTIYLDLSDMQVELRRLVALWMRCDRDLRKLFALEPPLAERSRDGRTILYVGVDGKADLEWFPVTPEEHLVTEKYDFASPNDNALRRFVNLIVSPGAEMLAGPCVRCDRYFLRNTKHARRYCSKTCSSSTTAVSSVKRKRERERKEKLQLAEARTGQWSTSSTRVDWIKWMLEDPQFSRNWLTRAVKNGEFKPPQAKSNQRTTKSRRSL